MLPNKNILFISLGYKANGWTDGPMYGLDSFWLMMKIRFFFIFQLNELNVKILTVPFSLDIIVTRKRNESGQTRILRWLECHSRWSICLPIDFHMTYLRCHLFWFTTNNILSTSNSIGPTHLHETNISEYRISNI